MVLIRPSLTSVIRAANRWALMPRPGKSRGQLETMVLYLEDAAMAGAATVAATAAVPATPAVEINFLRSINFSSSCSVRLSLLLGAQTVGCLLGNRLILIP